MSLLDKSPKLDGVKDVLPTYASLFVNFDPLKVSRSEVEKWCLEVSTSGSSDADQSSTDSGRLIEIPVHYGGEGGPDIEEAAKIAGLSSADDVIRIHSGGDYRVYFLGFLGGFPYLGGLDEVLAKVPRLTTPRMRLPKGTVGIAGGQTGVYTISTPGGWYCLGRTPMNLFEPSQDPPAKLRAGDKIKFIPTDGEIVEQEVKEQAAPVPASPWIEILSPGALATVQDMGRRGYARHGVSRSGAADDLALRMGNALLGNAETDAGIEVTMGGMKVRCLDSCAIALTGADCGATVKQPGSKETRALPVNEVVQLQKDDELKLDYAKDGMRSYLCVQGGVDVPVVLGSRSTDIRGGLGGFLGRAFTKGDTVGRIASAGSPATGSKSAHDPLRSGGVDEAGKKTWQIRVLPGPAHPSTEEAQVPGYQLQSVLDCKFIVSSRADRMAVVLNQEGKAEADAAQAKIKQLEGVPYGLSEYELPELLMRNLNPPLIGGQQMSEGTGSGTIQLPPDGNPVILLAEHQTTGGYKVPAVVIQADMWQVGQMKPGDSVRLVLTKAEDAVAALDQLHRQAQKTK